jgi:formate-dependent nitrite reductase membrane component NrfD
MKLSDAGRHKMLIWMTIVASILALVGGFLLRYVVLIGGQMIF